MQGIDYLYEPSEDELLPPSCVLYLPGVPAGGSKILDKSRFGNHGIISGAAWTRLPSGFSSLLFNGSSDKVTITTHTGFPLGTALTILVWAKTSAHAADIGQMFCNVDETLFSGFMIRIQSGYLAGFINDGGWKYLFSTAIYNDGIWHQFAMEGQNGQKIKGYVDTVEIGYTNQDTIGTMAVGDTTLYLGRRHDGADQWFNGSIAFPLRVINGTLTPRQRVNYYNRECYLFGRSPK